MIAEEVKCYTSAVRCYRHMVCHVKVFCECAVEGESMNFLLHQHDTLLVHESV
jgi:hypothetical protein